CEVRPAVEAHEVHPVQGETTIDDLAAHALEVRVQRLVGILRDLHDLGVLEDAHVILHRLARPAVEPQARLDRCEGGGGAVADGAVGGSSAAAHGESLLARSPVVPGHLSMCPARVDRCDRGNSSAARRTPTPGVWSSNASSASRWEVRGVRYQLVAYPGRPRLATSYDPPDSVTSTPWPLPSGGTTSPTRPNTAASFVGVCPTTRARPPSGRDSITDRSASPSSRVSAATRSGSTRRIASRSAPLPAVLAVSRHRPSTEDLSPGFSVISTSSCPACRRRIRSISVARFAPVEMNAV